MWQCYMGADFLIIRSILQPPEADMYCRAKALLHIEENYTKKDYGEVLYGAEYKKRRCKEKRARRSNKQK